MADIDNPHLKKIKEESDDFSFLDLSVWKKSLDINKAKNEVDIDKQIQSVQAQQKQIDSQIESSNQHNQTKNSSSSHQSNNSYSEKELNDQLAKIKSEQWKLWWIKDYFYKIKNIIWEWLSIKKSTNSINWSLVIVWIIVFWLFVWWTVYYMKNNDNPKDWTFKATILKEWDNPSMDGHQYSWVISEVNLKKYEDKKNNIIKLGDILWVWVDYYFLKTNKTLLDKDLIEFDVMNLHTNKICKSHVEYVTKAKETAIKYKDIWIEFKDKIEDNKKLVKINEWINNFYVETKEFIACLNNNNLKTKFEEFKWNKPDLWTLKNILSSVKTQNTSIDNLKNDINQLEKLTNEFFGYDWTNLWAQDNKLLNSLWVEVNDWEMSYLITKWTTLPVNTEKEYWTKFPNQKVMQFDIFQWDNPIAKNNINIWKLTITWLKPLPEIGKRVKVNLKIDNNWLLEISATDILNPSTIVSAQIQKNDNIKWMEWSSLNIILDVSNKMLSTSESISTNISAAIND